MSEPADGPLTIGPFRFPLLNYEPRVPEYRAVEDIKAGELVTVVEYGDGRPPEVRRVVRMVFRTDVMDALGREGR